MKPPVALLIDDEEDLLRSTAQALDLEGLSVIQCASAEEALNFLSEGFNGVVVTDIRMPGMDGMTLMARTRELDADIPVIVVTGHADVQLAVRAMREGAYDFIEKPYNTRHLAEMARRALDRRRLVLENRELRAVAGKRDDIEARLPGRTSVMVDLRYRIRAAAPTDADLLIVGDTGSGKEVVARAIHDLSPRATRPVVVIDCAALPASLIESELFGHEAGAFPGAMRQRYGKFEHARGGTILLDEIGSMPIDLQTKLLRVIQERTITRLGSNEPVPLDVRFIALSKIDLQKAVADGRFRDDLFYRLNVVSLQVPALADRREDIPLLFMQLAREAAGRYRRDEAELPQQLLRDVAMREWPGNVRELRNAADRHVLGLDDMAAAESATGETAPTLPERVAAYEKSAIAAALLLHGGKLKPVYEELGISRKTLYEKMVRYGLGKDDQDKV